MRHFKILILFLILIIVSCKGSLKNEGTRITGRFQNAAGVKLILRELDVDSIHNLDSTILDEQGLFRFRINQSESGFYILKSSSGEYILLLLEKDEEAIVFADLKKQPFDYNVTGSPGSMLLKDFYDHTLINLLRADSLRSILMKNRESPDFYKLSISFDTLFSELTEDQKNIEKEFIRQNSNSLASLIVVNYKFGMKTVLSMEEDFPVFLKLDSILQLKYPGNKHMEFHRRRVMEHKRQDQEKESKKRSNF
jgi:hypothetical protein